MKPIYLLTGLLAWTTLVVTSCSAPRMAQQASIDDDVYNSTARAVEYQKPARTQAQQYLDEDTSYTAEDDYGTSDPYADMNYSSRINRFYYGGPFRSYYDPYFDGFYGYNPYYSGFSLGIGFGYGFGGWGGWGSPFMGGYWGPYSSFGYSPFWGYSSWPYGGYYGGYYGGGYLGGYYGGGYLVGNRGNVSYGGRPSRGRENGASYTGGGAGFGMGAGATRTINGNVVNGRSRSERYGAGRGVSGVNPNRGATLDARTRTNNGVGRPTRSGEVTPTRSTRPPERYNAPTRSERPTYSAPSNYGGGGRSMGGGGGASRPSRGGGRG
jgi:hypothetical protein